MLIVVCGVSGSGKTTVGKMLSEALALPFHDADDYHPVSNVEKMANGQPLEDADRQPWLEELAARLSGWQEEGGAVLACSALKESYRATLESRCADGIRWVFLTASEAVLADRLAARKGHFFDRNLLASQFEDLEVPSYSLHVDAGSSPQEIVDTILQGLQSK